MTGKDLTLTVVCVFRATVTNGLKGGCYDASWVQKLKRNVSKHLTIDHKFICLTNTIIPEVECVSLKYPSWDGWWSKIELFEPNKFNGPVLFLDLDLFVTSSLNDFVKPRANLVMLRDHLVHIKNSSIMFWDGNDECFHSIFHTFKANAEEIKKQHLHVDSLGDQGFIRETLEKQGYSIDVWQDLFGSEGFIPFSISNEINPILKNGILPSNTRIVYCLGYPKFHEFKQLKFVQEHWLLPEEGFIHAQLNLNPKSKTNLLGTV